MKANELMIGDWVQAIDACCGEPCILRVTYIDKWKLERPHVGVDGDISQSSLPADCLEGIPITAEILGKNGFVHRQSVTWGDVFTYTYAIVQKDKVLQYEQHFNLSPNPYDGSGFYWIPEMSAVSALRVVYVHELQHLLRLCGIEKDIIEL